MNPPEPSPRWQFSASGRTLAMEDRDYPEWHKGRAHYGVWLVDVDMAAVHTRISRARAHLSPLLGPLPARPHLQRQPHITLFVCGFIEDAVVWDDDFSPAMLAAQQTALKALPLAPFTLHIGALDSFDSAVFLRVHDSTGGLAALRQALGQGVREIRQSPYVPHVTVGLYRGAFDTTRVAEQLQSFADEAPIPLRVERIHFARYNASELAGPLHPLVCHVLQAPVGPHVLPSCYKNGSCLRTFYMR